MKLGVLLIDGHRNVFPQRQIVGAAVVQQGEEIRDGGWVGEFDDVAIAVEEILEDAEVKHVDSHSDMVSMPMLLRRIVRYVGLAVAGLVLALFLAVQRQQWVLRRQAEQLHAEIVALQMHPGTFADVQRMEREWGKFGHWDGECTARNCIYRIRMADWLGRRAVARHWDIDWLLRPYSLLGGRIVFVDANVRVLNNRMWGEDFRLTAYTPYNWKLGKYYFGLFVSLKGSPRLFAPGDMIYNSALEKGYRDGFEAFCTGCVGAEISVTPQTRAADVRWLTRINFDCVNKWNACRTEDDLIPEAWARHHSLEFRGPNEHEPFETPNLRSASIRNLGREVDEAAIVEMVRLTPDKESPEVKSADVRILERLKNGDEQQIGSIENVMIGDKYVALGAESKAAFLPGSRFILGYRYSDAEIDKGIWTLAIRSGYSRKPR